MMDPFFERKYLCYCRPGLIIHMLKDYSYMTVVGAYESNKLKCTLLFDYVEIAKLRDCDGKMPFHYTVWHFFVLDYYDQTDNIALTGSASQKSQLSNAGANKAIDGARGELRIPPGRTGRSRRCAICPNVNFAWWSVDFGSRMTVKQVWITSVDGGRFSKKNRIPRDY